CVHSSLMESSCLWHCTGDLEVQLVNNSGYLWDFHPCPDPRLKGSANWPAFLSIVVAVGNGLRHAGWRQEFCQPGYQEC
ncbi:hypothetical protein HispidOSU_014128, partial [Sigmodon hispidus]